MEKKLEYQLKLYDQDYIESLYLQYQNRECDDTVDFDMLKRFNGLKFKGKAGDDQSKEDINNANKTTK